jgi:DNA-binding transcriptional LysR family regulator
MLHNLTDLFSEEYTMRSREFVELRALASIAAHGNFARAASQLGVSRSALSQTIRGLEERLGVRLLNRTTRSVAPSEAGARLLARISPAFAEIDAAQTELGSLRNEPAGLLRINTPRFAALFLLAPRLGEFHRAHPAIHLDLVVQDSLADIVAERFDAGIRLGEALARDMIAVPLSGEQEMFVVAAPSYLAEHGTPRHPRDLAKHRCINLRMPTDMSTYRWELEQKNRKLEVAVEGPLVVNANEVALAAALQGVGLAYLFDRYVEAHLAAGKLVRVLAAWTPPFAGFYLYHPSRRQTPPALRAFIEFFRYELRKKRA